MMKSTASSLASSSSRSTHTLPKEPLSGAGFRLMRFGSGTLYFALAVIFIWVGAMKFTDYEAAGIAGFVMNSPIVSWWHAVFGIQGTSYMLGVYEISTGLLLAARMFSPSLSLAGAVMSIVTYLVTLSFMLTTPGVAEPLAGGFPALSAFPGQFLAKDLALLAISIYCLGESMVARESRRQIV